MHSCFGLFRPHQHIIASKQTQVPKKNISNGKSSMPLGCCNMSTLVVDFTLSNYHKKGSKQLSIAASNQAGSTTNVAIVPNIVASN